MNISIQRVNDNIAFEARNEQGNTIRIDGDGSGFRPMEALLSATATCAAFDFVGILKKQRQELTDLRIEVSGERPDAVPAPFKNIRIHFFVKGNVDKDKAHRAAELSVHKYCSVGSSLDPLIQVDFEVITEGTN